MSEEKKTPPKASSAPDTNIFGGRNPHGLYVPMSEDEQEVVSRLVESDDLEVVVHGWATLEKPKIQFGDFRIKIVFRLDFFGPPVKVFYFDLELRTRAGLTLFRERQPISPDGGAILVQEGIYLDLVWDIAIDHMHPNVVKCIKPGALGLTSRRIDKDTKERTARGNMQLNERTQFALEVIEKGSSSVKADDLQKKVQTTQAAGDPVRMTEKGPEAPGAEE